MSAPRPNPLLSDRDVAFQLYEVLEASALCALPGFTEHSRDTFDLVLDSTRRFAREVLYPTYRPMDAEPPVFKDGRVHVHPLMRELYPRMVELGLLTATRPPLSTGCVHPRLPWPVAGSNRSLQIHFRTTCRALSSTQPG